MERARPVHAAPPTRRRPFGVRLFGFPNSFSISEEYTYLGATL